MDAFLLFLLAVATPPVPEVIAGPDLAREAREVAAPIRRVTVFSDRARVRREAAFDLRPGVNVLRLPDLPGAVLLATLRVDCDAGRVIRVEAAAVERERFSVEQVEALLDRLEALTDEIAVLDARKAALDLELEFLDRLLPAAPVPEAKRAGRSLPPISPGVFSGVLAFLDARREKAREALRALAASRAGAMERVTALREEVARHDLGAFTDRRIQVVALVEAREAGRARVGVEYFVPGARWLPSYDVHFAPERRTAALHAAGIVEQSTGEDWTEVEIALSTAIPGQGIDLPERLTWTLGERGDFLPLSRAVAPPQEAPRFPRPRPSPAAREAADAASERAARLEVLLQRLDELEDLASGAPSTTTIEEVGPGGPGGAFRRGVAAQAPAREAARADRWAAREAAAAKAKGWPPPPSPPPPAPGSKAPRAAMPAAPAVASPEAYAAEDRSIVDAEEQAAPPPSAASGVARGRSPTSGTAGLAASLALFEPEPPPPPSFDDPRLPAVAAGGLDFVYVSPVRVTVPGDGRAVRVPLARDEYPVETFYEASPALTATAYLKATVTNKGNRPLLGGPANLFVGRDFAGQGTLATTGAGGTIELPLGADEDIRLLRRVVPATTKEGLLHKEVVTTYTVTIEVGNYKRHAVRISLVDQVPKSREEDVSVHLERAIPKPVSGPDEDGVLRWMLEIPAGKTEKVEFLYRIRRPPDVELYQ